MSETKQSKFQYQTPRILRCDFRSFPECEAKEWTININHTKTIKRESESEADVTLFVAIRSDEEATPFSLEFEITSHFKWEELEEPIISSLLNRNAPSLLLGFARPVLAMLTNSSGMPPYNIPMLDFSQDPMLDVSVKLT